MKRLGRWVVGISAAGSIRHGHGGSSQSSTPDSGKFAAAFTVGATLGNKSSYIVWRRKSTISWARSGKRSWNSGG